jgi:hypothetical protein
MIETDGHKIVLEVSHLFASVNTTKLTDIKYSTYKQSIYENAKVN